jgi:hypothetical protein
VRGGVKVGENWRFEIPSSWGVGLNKKPPREAAVCGVSLSYFF